MSGAIGGFTIGVSAIGGANTASWPPTAPTSISKTLPSYLYAQYSDDDNLQAFVSTFNAMANEFVAWFNALNLPIYTGLSGALLDWVANGLYGIARPLLAEGTSNTYAAYGTEPWLALAYAGKKQTGSSQFTTVTDDVFKRIITWNFYKGDGFQYSTAWLKRRVHRFLNGFGFDTNTYDVSVAYSGSTVTIKLKTSQLSQIFKLAMNNGVLAVPFQYIFTVTLD